MKRALKAIVIGGGIHGLTTAMSLSNECLEVTVLEKNKDILSGTSGATHNRAHVGYHYPRSKETAIECLEGLNFFKNMYPGALVYPKESYYFIDKEKSKTSFKEFKNFCDDINIPYSNEFPDKEFVIRDSLEGSFKVNEPIFNLKELKRIFEIEFKDRKINVVKNSKVESLRNNYQTYELTCKEGDYNKKYSADIVVNATYAYSNNLLKIMGLEEEMTEYILQKTEIPVVKSKKDIPAMTVMDGEFVSIMPLASEKNIFLLYDVINSVIRREQGFLLNEEEEKETKFKYIIERGRKYFPFVDDLQYVKSVYGYRPIPVKSEGDSRKTRIKTHNRYPGIYSILEGKFISAPLTAEKITLLMKEQGVINGKPRSNRGGKLGKKIHPSI